MLELFAQMEEEADADAEESADFPGYMLEEAMRVPESMFVELEALIAATPNLSNKASSKAETETETEAEEESEEENVLAEASDVVVTAPAAAAVAPASVPVTAAAAVPVVNTDLPYMRNRNVAMPVPSQMANATHAAFPQASGKALVNIGVPIINGTAPLYLPALPARVFGKCAAEAAEYIDCSGGMLTDAMTGSESEGFCMLEDQVSALNILELRDYTSRFEHFRRQLRKFAASVLNVAPVKTTTDRFNKEDDYVKLCFLPGTAVERKRYQSRGQFGGKKLGDAAGFFKPVVDIQCDSVFCKSNKIVQPVGSPSNMVLNLQP
jgi:hypothetical protein